MFFCGKKIGYLSLYEREEKAKSAGFIRICGEKDKVRVTLQIKNLSKIKGWYPLYFEKKGEKLRLDTLEFTAGTCLYEKCFKMTEDKIVLEGGMFSPEEIEAAVIVVSDDMKIEARWREASQQKAFLQKEEDTEQRKANEETERDKTEQKITEQKETERDKAEQQITEQKEIKQKKAESERRDNESGKKKMDPFTAEEELKGQSRQVEEAYLKDQSPVEMKKGYEQAGKQIKWEFQKMPSAEVSTQEDLTAHLADFFQEDIEPDKWKQLLKQFKNVHPFGDERLFISIEPKDFVVLREDYQKLVHNSFLLHGFYNYRHLILGKDCKMGNAYETCFYLGVPGTFFEREKMVAVMFGFEGFECEGPVEIGKYGYYLRQVKI